MTDYKSLSTEGVNEKTENIDKMSAAEIVALINAEDKTVAFAVEGALNAIASVIDQTAARLKSGGRLFYVGAGTSGRLGVLDASECPPTYGVDYSLVQGVMIGGETAVFRAVEGAEDDENCGADELKNRGLTDKDVVVGLSASGGAPSVLGAVRYAKTIGALTACITCNESALSAAVNIPVVVSVGAEVISGSTRMKAGTAQKMVLNMISTGVMIKLGYVRGNKMTRMRPTNNKLKARAASIIAGELKISEEKAASLFARHGSIEKAIEEYKKENG